MSQANFVKTAVHAALLAKGYKSHQAQRGAEEAKTHYCQGSNFKPNAITACTQYAIRTIGKPQK